MAVAPHQIVIEKGAAVGRLTGFSHLALICRDMDETVRFYRDILGLNLISTSGEAAIKARNTADSKLVTGDAELAGTGKIARAIERPFSRQYFFGFPNGDSGYAGITFYELPDSPDVRDVSPSVGPHMWPGDVAPSSNLFKMDHLAFHVPTKADVEWFVEHLTEHGVEVLGPFGTSSNSMYVHRIYFYDPAGNPLEIGTYELADDPSIYFRDEDPVPSLLEE